VSVCGLTVPEGMANRMNSAVMAQLHCGYRDRRRVRPLFSHMAIPAERGLPARDRRERRTSITRSAG
jgi:hypothetical protein